MTSPKIEAVEYTVTRQYFDNALAAAREEGARLEREKVAAWMVGGDYATGHGDTMTGLLAELEWQCKERGAGVAIAAAKEVAIYWCDVADEAYIEKAIDALSITEILKEKS